MLYDVCHMQVMGEDVASDIAQNLDVIGHIHVSQAPGMAPPMRKGAIDFRKVVSCACAAGYSGFWGLEFHPEGDKMESLIEARKLLNSFN